MSDTKQGGLKLWQAIALFGSLFLLTLEYGIFALLITEKVFHYPLMKDLGLAYCINIFCFALVVMAGTFLFDIPVRSIFPLKRLRLGVYPLLILLFTGTVIIGSEVDNLCRFLFHYKAELLFADAMAFNYWSAAVAIVILAPVFEETLFRGFLLQNLLKRYPAALAIPVSAIIFGLIHGNWQQLFPASFIGLILGWCFYRTRSIIPGILGHMLNNGATLMIPLIPFSIPGFNGEMTSGNQFQPLWFDVLGLLLILAGVAGVYLLTREKRVDPLPQIPQETTSPC